MSQTSQVFPLKFSVPKIPNVALGFIIALGTGLVILVFSLLAYQIYFLNRVHLGVEINGLSVSRLTRPQLEQVAAQQAAELLNRPVTLIGNGQSYTFSSAQLGATVDVQQTVDLAYAVGRTGSFWGDLQAQKLAYQRPVKIVPVINFDSGPANAALTELAKQINQPVQNAQLILHDNLSLEAIPAQTGQTLDIEMSRAAIAEALLIRNLNPIPLTIHSVEPTITSVEETRRQLESFLSHPLTLRFDEQTWNIAPQTLAKMVIIENQTQPDNSVKVTARLNPEPLADYLNTLAFEINQPAINAWFDLDLDSWTLYPLKESQDGYTLDVARAKQMIADSINAPYSPQINLPVVVRPAAVSMHNTQALGINELVSSSTSYFKGSSAERMQNIEVSASKFHGLVIPPGEIFSFNQYLGDVSAENGFVESLIIQGDRTAVGIGGGVCQVSTTVFRAAFYGGFEIVERWAHGYRVGWYETASGPGLDATIYSPAVDFKFRNDTNSFILIQTETDLTAGTLTFNFYGTPANRTVIVSEPIESNFIPHGPPKYEPDPSLKPGEIKQVDWANDGVDVTIERTVLEGETVIHKDTIFSRYQPWQAVYRVGPAEAEE